MNYTTNYKKYLTAATLDNIANKIMSSTFIVGYAIYLGLSDRIIGLKETIKVTSTLMVDENNTENIKIIFAISIILFVVTLIYYKFSRAREEGV